MIVTKLTFLGKLRTTKWTTKNKTKTQGENYFDSNPYKSWIIYEIK